MSNLIISNENLTQLAEGQCAPLDGHYKQLSAAEIDTMVGRLPSTWIVVNQPLDHGVCKCLRRVYSCADYGQAATLTQEVAALAEQVQHHPRLVLEWRMVTVEINTHAVKGLAIGDFIFAAKTELLIQRLGLIDDSD